MSNETNYFHSSLLVQDETSVKAVLNKFVDENSSVFIFAATKEQDWYNLLSLLENNVYKSCHFECLTSIKLLSRDKTLLLNLSENIYLKLYSLLYDFVKNVDYSQENCQFKLESIKCLCNILLNVPKSINLINKFDFIKSTNEFLENFEKEEITYDIKLFHLKLLFLMSIRSEEIITTLYSDYNILAVINRVILFLIKDTTLNENNCKLISELLKILFNILKSNSINQNDNININDLVICLRELLCSTTEPTDLKLTYITPNVVNLFTVINNKYIPSLIDDDEVLTDLQKKPLKSIVDYLYQLISGTDKELITPVLYGLINITKSSRNIRKYLRSIVLPPLTDVYKRPEEGDTLRNKLCRLLTSPDSNVSNLVAEWIFILCKENIGRMVKYTGYGNAAGLLARRGLLGEKIDYSSDSEDSDTEIYLKNRSLINPITGCREANVSKPDPFQGMSEEQKEHITMELVNSIEKLHRRGLIQPCRIGDDGKPEPVEHILQLQTELPQQKDHLKYSEDD